jgi:hypothetical protein
MGFEPTIPVSELATTVHALDRGATVIGRCDYYVDIIVVESRICEEWAKRAGRNSF